MIGILILATVIISLFIFNIMPDEKVTGKLIYIFCIIYFGGVFVIMILSKGHAHPFKVFFWLFYFVAEGDLDGLM